MPKAKVLNQEIQAENFEQAIAQLEKIVADLQGEIKLDEALELFDKGVKLSQICERFLKTAEAKIEVLRKSANGGISTEPHTEECEI